MTLIGKRPLIFCRTGALFNFNEQTQVNQECEECRQVVQLQVSVSIRTAVLGADSDGGNLNSGYILRSQGKAP